MINYKIENVYKIERTDKIKNDTGILIHLEILFLCNYFCEYCYARARNKFDSMASKAELDRMLETLKQINFGFSVSILGGEPSIHPLLKYFLKELDKIKLLKKKIVITNCKKLIKEDILEYIDYIIPSLHTTQITNLENFKNAVDYYGDKLRQITCVYQPQHDDMIYDIFKYIIPKNIELIIEYGFDENFITNKLKLPEWIYNEYIPYIKQRRFHTYFFDNSEKLELYDIEFSELNLRELRGFECELREFALSFKQPTIFRSVCGNNISFCGGEINNKPDKQICNVSHCNCQSLTFGDKKRIENEKF